MNDLTPEQVARIEKRLAKKRKREMGIPNTGMTLSTIVPKTINQERIFDYYEAGKNLCIHGVAGTGKSFVAIYLAMRSIFVENSHKKLIIVRSSVATRNIGFLPGNDEEKMAIFETPYIQTVNKLFGRDDAYRNLKSKGIVEFISTSYIRGETWDDALIFIDEIQNMTFHELDSIITRLGDNCRVIFAGDGAQTDFRFEDEKSGLGDFLEIVQAMESFKFIQMTVADIVRSGLVKEYIIAKHQYYS